MTRSPAQATRNRAYLTAAVVTAFVWTGCSRQSDNPTAPAFDDQRVAARGAGNIITIDPPGSLLTQPFDINGPGAIVGLYFDNVFFSEHGFLRDPDGKFTTIDAPNAAQGTVAWSINPHGTIVGQYTDAGGVSHGFVRTPDGKYATIDAPHAGTNPGQGTIAGDINQRGLIAGEYSDGSSVWHGFVRDPDGTITSFDGPGASTKPGQGTFPSFASGLNPAGVLAGNYVDAGGVNHGFVRAADGTITKFDVKGAQGTLASSVSPGGVITGQYNDAGGAPRGYVRAADGTITKFDAPGAGNAPPPFPEGTTPQGINPGGVITGFYSDVNFVGHGFLRASDGTITTLDAPGAGSSAGTGTFPLTNNPSGAIVGYYMDASFTTHGFLRSH